MEDHHPQHDVVDRPLDDSDFEVGYKGVAPAAMLLAAPSPSLTNEAGLDAAAFSTGSAKRFELLAGPTAPLKDITAAVAAPPARGQPCPLFANMMDLVECLPDFPVAPPSNAAFVSAAAPAAALVPPAGPSKVPHISTMPFPAPATSFKVSATASDPDKVVAAVKLAVLDACSVDCRVSGLSLRGRLGNAAAAPSAEFSGFTSAQGDDEFAFAQEEGDAAPAAAGFLPMPGGAADSVADSSDFVFQMFDAAEEGHLVCVFRLLSGDRATFNGAFPCIMEKLEGLEVLQEKQTSAIFPIRAPSM